MLAAARRAALRWARPAATPTCSRCTCEPELDIVTYFPRGRSLSAVDAASERVLDAGMDDADDPVFLSTLRVTARRVRAPPPGHRRATPTARASCAAC